MASRVRVWKVLPLWIVIAVSIGWLGSVLISELRHRGKVDTPAPGFSNSDLVLTGVHVVTIVDGVMTWELNASRAQIYEGQHQARLDNVHGIARPSDGTVVRFEGATGTFDTMTHDVELQSPGGGTIVQWSNGYVVSSDVLRWNQATQEATSDRLVSITGPRVAIRGVGLRIRPASQELTLLSQVQTHVF